MNKIESTFGKDRVFLPVIHPNLGKEAVMDNVNIAVEAKADGIFLINQGMEIFNLLDLIPEIKAKHPDLWVGMNFLGWNPEEILDFPFQKEHQGFQGIWADDCGVDSPVKPMIDLDAGSPSRFIEAREKTNWQGLYFGGTAFKTQQEVHPTRLEKVCKDAASFVDVVTTSGRGTGIAADLSKIQHMRFYLGDHPMGLASGVTPGNVMNYLPYVEAFLVATGIEKRMGEFDPERTQRLSEKINAPWDRRRWEIMRKYPFDRMKQTLEIGKLPDLT